MNALSFEIEAVVTLTIERGRTEQVQFQGSWWNARSDPAQTLLPGQSVHVVGCCNLTTLYVIPPPLTSFG